MPSPATTLPAGSPMARARGAWRAVFVLAALVVTTGTHWPKLTLGQPDQPIDKLLHCTAFAGLTAFLVRTGWIRPLWAAGAVMLAWGAVDEVTQGIPGLQRSVDLDDWLADATGVLLALAFTAAFALQGGGLARLLGLRRRVAMAWLFSRPLPWMHLATGAVLGAAVGGPVAIWLDSLFVRKSAQPWQYGTVGGVLGAIGGAHLLLELGTRAGLRRNAALRSCLACGTPAPDAAPDAPCTACGAARTAGDWAPVAALPGSEELRLCLAPILQGVATLVALSLVGVFVGSLPNQRVPALSSVSRAYNASAVDFRILMDLALLAFIGAWTTWRCRRRIARRVDQGRDACLACGFDLRAASGDACPECGAPIPPAVPTGR